METIWDAFVNALAVWLPRVLSALGILLLGWIIALLARALTRKVLSWTKLDARLAKRAEVSTAPPPPPGAQVPGGPPAVVQAQPPREKPTSVEEIISQFVYYLILFMAFLGALNALGMTEISALFNTMFDTIFAFLPRVLYALALAGIAWLLARLLKTIVTGALARVGVDKRVSESAEMTAEAPVSSAIGEAVYWLVWLLFLPAILGVLGLEGILVPIQAMLTSLLSIVPSLLAAAVIIIVGLFIARILQRITASALHAFGADALAERVGVSRYLGKANLSGLIGYIVYIIVLVPVVIAALNVTGLTYLAEPLSDMLNQILLAIPKIFVAAAVLAIAFLLGRVFGDLVSTLLANAGFDNLVARLSLGQVSETPKVSPSKTVGWVVLAAFMLFGSLAAASLVGWTAMVAILGVFIAFLGRLILGLIVLIIGIYLADLASKFILNTGLAQRRVVALLARVTIIVFATAMALDQIGVANDIVNLAFGLTLAGAALAAALAFGLGGQDVAKYQLVRMYKSAEASLATPPPPDATLPEADLQATLPSQPEPEATLPDSSLPDATLPSEPEVTPEDSTGDEGDEGRP